MEDGRWKMEDGRWKMEDGRWKMESRDFDGLLFAAFGGGRLAERLGLFDYTVEHGAAAHAPVNRRPDP
jgi:hypothetical protein